MSIAAKLQAVSAEKKPSFLCKLGTLLSNNTLSKEDLQNVNTLLSIPKGTHRPVSDFELSKILSDENIYISPSTIERHRKSICSCGRPTK